MLRRDGCRCPAVPFRDDPYFVCDACEAMMEARAEAEALAAMEAEHEAAFEALVDQLNAAVAHA